MPCNEFFFFYVRKVTKKYLYLQPNTLLNKLKIAARSWLLTT